MEKGEKNGRIKKNQVTVIETEWREIETNLKNWLDKPPVMVEAAVAAVKKGVTGAFISLVLDALAGRFCSDFHFPFLPPLKAVPVKQLIDPLYMSVLMGSDSGIRCFMKKTQRKKDVKTRMIVARDPPAHVVLNGVFFALARPAVSKFSRKKTLRKERVQYRMVVAFAAGILASICRGDPPLRVILNGVFYALVVDAVYKAVENKLKNKDEEGEEVKM